MGSASKSSPNKPVIGDTSCAASWQKCSAMVAGCDGTKRPPAFQDRPDWATIDGLVHGIRLPGGARVDGGVDNRLLKA
jgi:hypothetical protein